MVCVIGLRDWWMSRVMRKKLKLVFLYRWFRRQMGGSIMRIAQMVDHMRCFQNDQFDVVVRPISRARRPLTRAMLALVSVVRVFGTNGGLN